MESREDLKSILPFLPVVLRSSSLFWPSQVIEALKALSRGPDHSRVDSGKVLFLAISDIRQSLSLTTEIFTPSAADGYSLFFDELMSHTESKKWFGEVVPALANLLLRFPSLLERHYQNADGCDNAGRERGKTGLRILGSQQAGIVFLSQELIGALLTCSFFCLFPTSKRGAKQLPAINFDHLFSCLYDDYSGKMENKVKCIIHYFERICACMPVGFVSFERKVLPLERCLLQVSYPKADFWSKSVVSLCHFQVQQSGFIEDQSRGALEVDFANKYLGGGALHRGSVQEEIRFMINPELIAGMLFLPKMSDNEAIEIVGTERFSNYAGYATSFRFSGDYVDEREVDIMGRRKTRIIAMDALCSPGTRQYELNFLLRETNKAFCGFFDQSKYQRYQKLYQDDSNHESQLGHDVKSLNTSEGNILENSSLRADEDDIGIVTGNWGCGAFGGDPELKTIIQWLAASQALRPFISYHTFGIEALHNLDQVSEWILSHEWTVGDLWNMLVDYSSKRLKGETNLGFFNWLLPSLSSGDVEMRDVSPTS